MGDPEADGGPVAPRERLPAWASRNSPARVFASQYLSDRLRRLVEAGWFVACRSPLAMPDSEPKPDVAVIRGEPRHFLEQNRHPSPAEVEVVAEQASRSVDSDAERKPRFYATAGVGQFWSVDIAARRIVVYSEPSASAYRRQCKYGRGEEVPVLLFGREVGRIQVAELFL